MAVCPKCSYALVLLPKRLRYKCAKCGRLYLQKFIEYREFRRFNRIQRELTKDETERYFEEIWKAYKILTEPKKQKQVKEKRPKVTEEEKRQKKRERDKRYYYRHKEKVIQKTKVWRNKNKEHRNKWTKQYRQKRLEKLRQQGKIQYWRNKQKALALQASENKQYKASKPRILTSVSTYSLAHLLFVSR